MRPWCIVLYVRRGLPWRTPLTLQPELACGGSQRIVRPWCMVLVPCSWGASPVHSLDYWRAAAQRALQMGAAMVAAAQRAPQTGAAADGGGRERRRQERPAPQTVAAAPDERRSQWRPLLMSAADMGRSLQ